MFLQAAFFVLVVCVLSSVQGNDTLRQTSYGLVKGTTLHIADGGSVECYLGLPYSTPPVGNMRFQPPSEHPKWQDTYDATKFRPFCPRLNSTTNSVIGDEDCLHLNIYVPVINQSDTGEALAVLIWIHPTDNWRSYSDFYDGRLLAWYASAIVVTFNYRVGALGFLSTGDSQSPGNYGLMDQVAALRWVSGNIHSFGGDSKRITIAGESAGAVASELLAISATVDDAQDDQIFHRVIAQSGSAFSDSVIDHYPENTAKAFVADVGCSALSNALSMECLRQADNETIVRAGVSYRWRAVVDGEILTGTPEQLIKDAANLARLRGRYQYMSGINDFGSPASFESVDGIQDAESFISYMNAYLDGSFMHPEKIADAVFLNYIDWNEDLPTNPDIWKEMAINSTRDKDILSPSMKFTSFAADQQGLQSDSFFYLFWPRPSEAIAATQWAYSAGEQYDWVTGARIGEELPYLFGAPFTSENSSDYERQMSIQMMRYWGNFVKNGDPNIGEEPAVNWPKFNASDSRYLLLGMDENDQTDVAKVGGHLETDKVVFWNQEVPLYNAAELDTSNTDDFSNVSLTDPIVTTSAGTVKGLRFNRDGYIVDRFFRIPYAQAPIGQLRFQRPRPHPGWNGTLDCSDRSSAKQWLYICPQRNVRGNGNVGREDCLNLNIWVPGGVGAQTKSPLPVMLWIYGGGNQIGTNIGFTFFYDMERITAQGSVIGITMNYRLNSLGFLSTDDDVVPGNMGMLDQVAAMEWVQQNIANFGGDPSKVTIFGESAGGASVSMHMLSPLSKNLFLRGISESGCVPSTWTYSTSGLSQAVRLGERLNCPTTTTTALVECLRYQPLNLLISSGVGVGFGAVVDGYFIPSDPKYIINASSSKDYMIGHNSMEGHGVMSGFFPALNLGPDRLGSNMDRDDVRRAARIFDPSAPDFVSEAVAYKYIDWNEPESAYLWPRLAITAIATDWTFAMGGFANAEIRADSGGPGRTYVYVFGENSRVRLFPDWVESNHLREMVYTFGHPFEDSRISGRFNDSDRALSRAMMTYWTNFAWSGDPNYPNSADIPIAWPEYEVADKKSILLNTSMYEEPEKYIRPNYMGDRYHMWREILYSMRDLPLDTCPAQSRSKEHEISSFWSSASRKTKIVNNPTGKSKSSELRAICPQSYLVRNTSSGCVEGIEYTVNGSIIERYLGIPYARPPVGALRFANPIEREPWADILHVKDFSKICPQAPYIDAAMDEDCLYLNIYVPNGARTNPLAVMVWIHGGGNQVGNGMAAFEGDMLAAVGDIVVVTVNYRLGSLGFLTTDDESSPGNYGLFDQHLAIKWIKSNIIYFDGDPDHITIAGNSAGAEDAHYHSLSPLTTELGINRALMQSAAQMPTDDMKQLDSAIRLGEQALCPTNGATSNLVQCLRDLSIQDLITAQASTAIGFYPTIDGVFLPEHPRVLSQDPDRIQLWSHLMGANDGDGSVGWVPVQDVTDEAGYHQAISTRFYSKYGWRTGSIDEQYGNYDDASFFSNKQKIQKSLVQAIGDELFIFPMHQLAIDYSQGGSDVYFYYYTYPSEPKGILAPPELVGAGHTSEIPLVFGEVLTDPDQDESVKELSLTMIRYWGNFIKSGDPNTDGREPTSEPEVVWPIYKDRTTDRNYIELNLGNATAAKTNLRPTEDAFWNDYMPRQSVYCEVTDPPAVSTTDPPHYDLNNPVVVTSFGEIQGMRVSNDYFDMHVYLGIPYAKPPINDLRFEKPEKLAAWSQPIEATQPKPPCIHLNKNNQVVGSEDCLYLDVFRRSVANEEAELIPILIWIHGDDIAESGQTGGSFWSGGGSPGWEEDGQQRIDPSYLANFGDLVVVRPNFRVGAFGYLATGDGQLRGNYGLWDLRAVVEWAVEFGELFGGDPGRITVVGHGSGAALAQMLGIIPSTSEDVTRVISQSGSAFSPWAFYEHDCTDSHSDETIASATGCSPNGSELATCLKSMSAEDLLSAFPYRAPTGPSYDETYNNWGAWRLRKDGDLIPETDVESLMAAAAFDFISGTASHEFYVDLENSLARDISLDEAIRQTYRYTGDSRNSMHGRTGDLLVHSYTPWQNMDDESVSNESVVLYYTDMMFQAASARDLDVKMRSENGSIYQYVLSKPSSYLDGSQAPSWLGGVHGDEISYVFGLPMTSPDIFTDDDREFSRQLMAYWSNFARTGDPNSKGFRRWLPYRENNDYMNLNGIQRRVTLRTTTSYNDKNSALWNEVIAEISPQSVCNVSIEDSNRQITKLSEECTADPVSIGNGIGLDLTPEDADRVIYILFSMCLILSTFFIGLLIAHCYISRKQASKHLPIPLN